jgi:hypothetical protein
MTVNNLTINDMLIGTVALNNMLCSEISNHSSQEATEILLDLWHSGNRANAVISIDNKTICGMVTVGFDGNSFSIDMIERVVSSN